MNKILLIILSVCTLLFSACAPFDGPPPDRERHHHHSDGPNEDRTQWDRDPQLRDRGNDQRNDDRKPDHRQQREDQADRASDSMHRGNGRSEAPQE